MGSFLASSELPLLTLLALGAGCMHVVGVLLAARTGPVSHAEESPLLRDPHPIFPPCPGVSAPLSLLICAPLT